MPAATRAGQLVIVLSSILCLAAPAHPATYYWTRSSGQPGDWSTAANWGGAEPTANDLLYVTNGGTITVTQPGEEAWVLRIGGGSTINQLGGSLSLSSLWDERGSFTYNLSGGLLSASPYYSGTINQSGGQFQVTGSLNIGGGRGPAYYTATGGTLEAPRIAVGATAGGAGTMNMNNSAGGTPVATVTGPNGIVVGGGSQGTLNMSGGMLQALAGPMTIGSSNTGVVNQTGGLISCTGLFFGRSFNGYATYTYNLDGGTLVLSFIELGRNGTYAKSRFNLGGGTLEASGDFTSAMPMTLTGNRGNANLDTAGFNVTLAGRVDGPGGLNKLGLNTLILNAMNDYTGPTVVNEGTLQVDGVLASSGTVTVQSSATLSGIGAVGQVIVAPGGQIAPGNALSSLGTLTFHGDLTLSSGARLRYDLLDSAVSDRISMPLSTLVLNGQQFSDFNFLPHSAFGPGTYTLIDANSIQGELGDDVTHKVGDYRASLTINGGDLLLIVSVPEPMLITLALPAASFFLAFFRRHTK